jgi:dephospho-CoA kinase
MKVVGITGGIGSGKTTVCKVFEVLGIPVFYSDDVSKCILFSDDVSNVVIKKFGEQVVINNQLNKAGLAKLVFSNKVALDWLNELLHPLVKQEFDKWINNQNSSFVLKEAAILFESGAYKSCDFVINVSCNKQYRINRIVQRDGRSVSEIESIMDKQWLDSERVTYSDFVINNSNKKLLPQIISLHQELL